MESLMDHHYVVMLGTFPSLVCLLILALTVHIDRYIRPELKRIMRGILIVVFTLVVQNYVDYRVTIGEPRWLLRTLATAYGYTVRPVILLLFLKVIAPQRRFLWGWILAGVNAAVSATAFFSPLCFQINAQNDYHRGLLGHFCLYVSLIFLVYLFVLTLRLFRPQERRETWLPVIALAVIAASLGMDDNVGLIPQSISFLTIAIIMSCMAYYIWLHLQFVREHEEALIAGQRVQLTLSQIRPHFLYNALNAISALCDEEPQRAKSAIDQFAYYLRGNMNLMNEKNTIPFSQELDHTKAYLNIEKMRFEDALQVDYHISCTDFRIPALTLEPLVENAVRHGVRGNKGGRGAVSIAARDAGNHFEVVITDDGPGFDPSSPPDDGKTHIGIANVRERLAYVCGGRLLIQSTPGEGTAVTILLPKEPEVLSC